MAIMEVEWKHSPEVVILKPGADSACPIDALRKARHWCSNVYTLDTYIHYIVDAFSEIDQYFYVDGRQWALRELIRAYATEIDDHKSWEISGRKHTIYRVPDDFADVLERVLRIYRRSRDVTAARRKLREAMKLSWKQFKDRALDMELVMEAAEAL